MMHKAWSSIEEVPYCFQGHTSNCKVTRLKKSSNLTQIGHFQTVTPVWIHWWIWNETQSLMWYRRHALLFFGIIHQISRSHRRKINDLNPIWVRLLGRSQLSLPSDLPCFPRCMAYQTGTYDMTHKSAQSQLKMVCWICPGAINRGWLSLQ